MTRKYLQRERACLWLAVAAAISSPAARLEAQNPVDSGRVDKTFFTRRDAVLSGIAVVGTGGVMIFDERIAAWARSDKVQGDSGRRDLFDGLTKFNETPLTLAAVATYGIGKLVRSETVADVGAHWTQAIVLNNAISELIRGPVGRKRPRVSQTDAFEFEFGAGFTKFENRAFPSLHSSSAFSTAAALFSEVRMRKPELKWVAGPLLFGAAMIPGITRVYLDQHWTSDVVAGAFVGTLLGAKVVHYAHTHKPNKLDRILIGATAAPLKGGGLMVGASFQP